MRASVNCANPARPSKKPTAMQNGVLNFAAYGVGGRCFDGERLPQAVHGALRHLAVDLDDVVGAHAALGEPRSRSR